MSVSVIIPDLGYGMVEATVVEWLIEIGGQVKEGQPILMIETDKVTTEVLSPAAGVLTRQDVKGGDVVEPRQTVGALGTAVETVPAATTPVPAAATSATPTATPAPATAAPDPSGRPIEAAPAVRQLAKEQGIDLATIIGTGNGGKITKDDVLKAVADRDTAQSAPPVASERTVEAAPVARQVAREHGIDLATVTGTGPNGRITKADVLKAMEERDGATVAPEPTPVVELAPISTSANGASNEATAPAPAAPVTTDAEDEIIPLTGIRKVIAERMVLSKRTAADVTTVAEVEMTEVKRHREKAPASYTAYVVRATALAIRAFPLLNSTLDNDRIIVKKAVNIAVAVAAPQGLVVPVIRNADTKSLLEIAQEIQDLSARAKRNGLTLHDFADGTFTVSNSGTFGSLMFTPIINTPQTAILGMGKLFEAAIVKNQQLSLGWQMYLCLTYDHRVIDGAPAVQFVQEIKRYLEKPWLLTE